MTVKEIRLKARAKINLTLDVTGKREDGYHLLETIMQTVQLYDGIYMKKLDKPEIKLKTNLPWLPVDERNLAWKAANLMRETYGIEGGVFIEIDKRIPVAAGLAGGSEYFLVEQDLTYGRDPFDCLKTSHDNLVKMGYGDWF